MKQYCRYCAFCIEADDFRCSNHPKGKQPHWNRKQINQANKCPNFALSDMGDVETGKKYRPQVHGTRERTVAGNIIEIAFPDFNPPGPHGLGQGEGREE